VSGVKIVKDQWLNRLKIKELVNPMTVIRDFELKLQITGPAPATSTGAETTKSQMSPSPVRCPDESVVLVSVSRPKAPRSVASMPRASKMKTLKSRFVFNCGPTQLMKWNEAA
jgi:hypothetical protein